MSQDAIIAELQRAAMEARSYQAGTLETAKSILAEQEAKIAKLRDTRPDFQVWLYSARGMVALIANDANQQRTIFRRRPTGRPPCRRSTKTPGSRSSSGWGSPTSGWVTDPRRSACFAN